MLIREPLDQRLTGDPSKAFREEHHQHSMSGRSRFSAGNTVAVVKPGWRQDGFESDTATKATAL
jgi:hypothetical protein